MRFARAYLCVEITNKPKLDQHFAYATQAKKKLCFCFILYIFEGGNEGIKRNFWDIHEFHKIKPKPVS